MNLALVPSFIVHFIALMNLIEILKKPEGKILEFKRDLSSPNGVIKTIIAFANTAGGTVLIGVEDGTRNVRGINSPLDLEERLANLISDRISPKIVPNIEILSWRTTQVLLVEVYPSPNRPHYLTQMGVDKGTYVRVGSTNRKADQDLIDELGRFSRRQTFDEQPMPGLEPKNLDFAAASQAFASVRKLKPSDLEILRLIGDHQGSKVPTVAGMLLFGTDRHLHFPDAWIQVGRFGGLDKTKILDHSEIRSFPSSSVEDAISFVQKHTIYGADIGPMKRSDHWNLPPAAVREAIINAVVHSDYSQRGAPIRISIFDDRLEVENPGLLPFGLTLEDLPNGISKLRNRIIGRVFQTLGLIEQWGSGIQRMTSACLDSGLPAPMFEEIATRFRVTIYTATVSEVILDELDEIILTHLDGGVGLSTSEISKFIGLTSRATRTRLAKLTGRGLIREIGTSPRDPRRRYFLVGKYQPS
jgi:predicted HTH transcriptional regulator